jgi:hypothetical protein
VIDSARSQRCRHRTSVPVSAGCTNKVHPPSKSYEAARRLVTEVAPQQQPLVESLSFLQALTRCYLGHLRTTRTGQW